MKFIFLEVLILFSLAGCASKTPQTEALLAKASPDPKSCMLVGVPFVEQSAGHCGPATLAMALRWAGKNISVDQLIPQVFTPGMKGSLQTDMISASRRQGMMALPIAGLEDLFSEIRAGHPVIVFENLSVSWFPQWHYAIVFGYDLLAQTVTMHSGPEEFKVWDLRKFERSWKLGDYWGLVVLRPDQLAASVNELGHVSAAAALERLGKFEEASTAYQQILKRWPRSLTARIGLGNIAYTRKQYLKAVHYLQQALVDHPASAVAWHNLAFAEAAAGNAAEAQHSAFQALRWVDYESRLIYADNLKVLECGSNCIDE